MNVLVLSGQRLLGQAVAGVLAEVAGFNVQTLCASVAEACLLIRCTPPGLLVLDPESAGDSYRDAVDLLLQRNPQAALLFLALQAQEFTLPDDLVPVTIAVLDKGQAWEHLLQALQGWWEARQGGPSLPGCAQQLQAIVQLTPREQRLLQELGCGLLNKEIAARLDLSVATVETYRKGVAAKLGVSGAELVRIATLYRCLRWSDGQAAPADP